MAKFCTLLLYHLILLEICAIIEILHGSWYFGIEKLKYVGAFCGNTGDVFVENNFEQVKNTTINGQETSGVDEYFSCR